MKEITLSSGVTLKINPLPGSMAQDLILNLMQQQLMDDRGNIIETDDLDELPQKDQMALLETVTDIIQDVLLEPGVVETKVPPKSKWLSRLVGRSYIRAKLAKFKEYGVDNPQDDKDVQRFLYIRYVAVGDMDDLNLILNNTLLDVEINT